MICDYQGKSHFFHCLDSREMSKAEEQGVTCMHVFHILPTRRILGVGKQSLRSPHHQERTWVDGFIPHAVLGKHTKSISSVLALSWVLRGQGG